MKSILKVALSVMIALAAMPMKAQKWEHLKRSTEFDTKVYNVYNLWTHKAEGKTSLKNKVDRKLTIKSRDVISYRLTVLMRNS